MSDKRFGASGKISGNSALDPDNPAVRAHPTDPSVARIGDWPVHPYLRMVPEMNAERFAALKENVELNGLMTPIVLDREGQIIDGRARARALIELDLADTVEPCERKEDNVAAFIIGNMIRANYTSAQLAIVGGRLLPPLRAEAAARRAHSDEVGAKAEAAQQARTLVGQGNEKYIRIAERLLKNDVNRDVVALIDAGCLATIPDAERLEALDGEQRARMVRAIWDNPGAAAELKTSDDEWLTPPFIIEAVVRTFGTIECDPSAPEDPSARIVPATVHYTKIDQGETKAWPDRTFCNPPFSNATPFVRRALRAAEAGHAIYLLLPVRPDAEYQREALAAADDVLFLGERVAFWRADGLGATESSRQVSKDSVMILGFNCKARLLADFGLSGTVMQYALSSDDEERRERENLDGIGYDDTPSDDFEIPDPAIGGALRALSEMQFEAIYQRKTAGRDGVLRSLLPKLPAEVSTSGTIVGSVIQLQRALRGALRFAESKTARNDGRVAIIGDSGFVRIVAWHADSVFVNRLRDVASSRDFSVVIPRSFTQAMLKLRPKNSPTMRMDRIGSFEARAGTVSHSTSSAETFPSELAKLWRLRRDAYTWERIGSLDNLAPVLRPLASEDALVSFEPFSAKLRMPSGEADLRIPASDLLEALRCFGNDRGLLMSWYADHTVLRIASSDRERAVFVNSR